MTDHGPVLADDVAQRFTGGGLTCSGADLHRSLIDGASLGWWGCNAPAVQLISIRRQVGTVMLSLAAGVCTRHALELRGEPGVRPITERAREEDDEA